MFGGNQADFRALSREDAEAWVRGLQGHPCAWVIEAKDLIGEIRLDRLDTAMGRATLAVGIVDRAALGRGYGPEAIDLVLQYAFGALGLRHVGLRVLAYNERAIRAYRKCGFVTEGRETASALVDGAWHDDLLMGISPAGFAASRAETE